VLQPTAMHIAGDGSGSRCRSTLELLLKERLGARQDSLEPIQNRENKIDQKSRRSSGVIDWFEGQQTWELEHGDMKGLDEKAMGRSSSPRSG
jgi:hypothetical protein